VTDVSAGIPTIGKDVKHDPIAVLGKIKKLHISHKGTAMKANNEVVDTVPGMVYAENENGQLHRLYNYRIDSLDQDGQDTIINKILSFMALSYHTQNGKLKETFKFAGKNTKETIPIVGHGDTMGIMDYFINWGETNKEWGIFIGVYEGKLAARFVHDGVKEFIDIEKLFDGKGFAPKNIRKNGDPEITTLTNFLETKFLNVSTSKINDKQQHKNDKYAYKFKLPTGWHMQTVGGKSIPIIDYVNEEDYNDYVLNNYLYTNIEEYDENEEEIPNFVNQYAKFDKDNIKKTPNDVKPKPDKTKSPASPTPDTGSARPVFAGDDINVDQLNEIFGLSEGNTDLSNVVDEGATKKLSLKDRRLANEQQKKEDDTTCNTKKTKPEVPPGAKGGKFNRLKPE